LGDELLNEWNKFGMIDKDQQSQIESNRTWFTFGCTT